jgi:hypothetical protein
MPALRSSAVRSSRFGFCWPPPFVRAYAERRCQVMGMVGPGVSANKKSASISETVVGVGGTTQWKMAAADHRTSPAFFFESEGAPLCTGLLSPSQPLLLQSSINTTRPSLRRSDSSSSSPTTQPPQARSASASQRWRALGPTTPPIPPWRSIRWRLVSTKRQLPCSW